MRKYMSIFDPSHEKLIEFINRYYTRRGWRIISIVKGICSEYALICIEDLNIKGMQKRWGRKISDYGFSEFIKILEYKAREIGSIVQKIDRYYPSSQICHVCGTKNPETKNLAVREWICTKCKTSHDRDRNAAINIWKVGASTFFGEI